MSLQILDINQNIGNHQFLLVQGSKVVEYVFVKPYPIRLLRTIVNFLCYLPLQPYIRVSTIYFELIIPQLTIEPASEQYQEIRNNQVQFFRESLKDLGHKKVDSLLASQTSIYLSPTSQLRGCDLGLELFQVRDILVYRIM